MRIAVTGASGLIGSALTESLRADGHDVIELVRRPPANSRQVEWDPMTGATDLGALAGTESIVHLAGAGVGDHRWTDSYKAEIRDSRVFGTASISRIAVELSTRPSLICGSAIGYYGDRGDEVLEESSQKGHGFLSDVVADWEAAADIARDAGTRVVHARTGLVASRKGGAWERMITVAKFGLAGKMGSGRQYWPFISLRDEVKALRFLIDNPSLAGPVNLVAPNPVTQKQAVKELAKQLHRPSIFPTPAIALRIVLGEFSSEVLTSHRVIPSRLKEAGFEWEDPTIEAATAAALQS